LMFPLPYKKCSDVPHAAKCGRHFHLSFQYKMYQRVPPTECRPPFAACGTPDRAIHSRLVAVGTPKVCFLSLHTHTHTQTTPRKQTTMVIPPQNATKYPWCATLWLP
jgi:hypothetical protein